MWDNFWKKLVVQQSYDIMIATVPYTSQYPLSVYDCRTKNIRQLTDWCDVLNYIFVKEDKLYLAAMDTKKTIITSCATEKQENQQI